MIDKISNEIIVVNKYFFSKIFILSILFALSSEEICKKSFLNEDSVEWYINVSTPPTTNDRNTKYPLIEFNELF